MKNILFFIIFCAITSISNAQKHDNIWPMGYIGDTAASACNYVIDFRDSFTIIPKCLGIEFSNGNPHAAICDTAGNLLFYTNGAYIADSSHQMMLNGDSLNNTGYAQYYEYGYPAEGIALPCPNNTEKYYLFHQERGLVPNAGGVVNFHTIKLNLTTIDMSLNNGLGAVTNKNQVILSDTMGGSGGGGYLKAAKHANGQDWWVLIPEWQSNAYYRFLVAEDTVLGPYRQEVGPAFHWIDYNG